ncbi:MAG: hypothetical protein K5919_05250 [Clostridiales bacterium]|nr:hypothetical protein [Clostridiales bacterium]
MPDNTIKTTLALDGEQQYTRAINEAKTSLRNLGTQLTLAKAEFNKDGDAMKLMQSRSQTLTQEIGKQQTIVKSLQETVKHCTEVYGENGVKTEKWQAELNRAKAALIGLETELNMNNAGLDETGRQFQSASEKAGLFASSVQGMDRTANSINFMAFNSAIGKVTDGMEKAVRGVAHLASELWDTMKDAATWADDKITLAQMYGIDVEELQRMQQTSELIDTPVEAIIKSRQKLSMGLSQGFTEDQKEVLTVLGLTQVGKYGTQVRPYDSAIDMMWDVGDALMAMGNAIDRDAYAQVIFGRSWMEMMPMFQKGRDEYEKTMASWSVVSQDNVQDLADLDDSMKTLENEFSALKLTVLSELASPLKEVSTALTSVLRQVNEYLQTDEGQEKLQALGDAVTKLFDGLTEFDAEQAISTVGSALDSVTGALTWISDNWDTVVIAIKAIGAAFIGLKAAEVAGSLAQGVVALKNLLGNGSSPSMPSVPGTNSGGSPSVPKDSGSPQIDHKKPAQQGSNGDTVAGDLTLYGLVVSAVLAAGLTPAYIADQADRRREQERLDETLKTAEEAAARTGQQNSNAMLAVRAAVAAFGESDRTNILGQAVMGDKANIDAAIGAVLGLDEGGSFLSTKTRALLQWNGMSGMGQYIALDTAMAEATEALSSPKMRTAADVVATLSDALDEITDMRDKIREHEFGNGNDEAVIRLVDSLISNPTIYGALSEGMQREVGRYLDPESGFGNGSNNRVVDAETMMNMLYGEMDAAFWRQVDPSHLPGSSTPNAEMQASWDAIVASVNDTAEGIKTSGNDAADAIEAFAGRVNSIVITGPKIHGLAGLLDTWAGVDGMHANGLPWVPYDNYLAYLHRGERVVPAGQNKSYTANNYLNVQSMYMNNGNDVHALAEAMAVETARMQQGFGG